MLRHWEGYLVFVCHQYSPTQHVLIRSIFPTCDKQKKLYTLPTAKVFPQNYTR